MIKANIIRHLVYEAIIFQNNVNAEQHPEGVEKEEKPEYKSMSDGPLGVSSFQKFSAFWTEVFEFLEHFEIEGK